MASSAPRTAEGQLRRARAELEDALRAGTDCRAETLLAAYPAVAAETEAAIELVYTEFVVRSDLGENPKPEQWYERFPQWRADLEQMFQVHDALCREEESRLSRTPRGSHGPTRPGSFGSVRLPSGIAGYEVQGELGRGGMGVVYKARQVGLNRTVALKLILAGEYAGEKERERFRREASAAGRLDHPNIVRMYEVGEHDGRPFCAMEYVAGGTLADRLTGSPWPARAAAEFVAAVAAAADHAHSRGVVHRDLKPANILLAGDPAAPAPAPSAGDTTRTHTAPALAPKVADFGLARCLADDAGPTRTGDFLGTPVYMAPEQARGKSHEAGPPADIWALGIILYELLTGHPPFQGDSAAETLQQVQHDEPVPPGRLRPRLPRDLETVCLKCLAKAPDKRYASAAALADDLGRWLRGEAILARPTSRAERLERWVRRNPRAAGLAGLVFALLAGGSVLFAYLWRDAVAAGRAADLALREKTTALGEREAAIGEMDAAIERLEHLRYDAQIGGAAKELEAGFCASAQLILGDCTTRFRGPEWDLLDRLTASRVRKLALEAERAFAPALHPDGRRMVLVELAPPLPALPNGTPYLTPRDAPRPDRPPPAGGPRDYRVRVKDFGTGAVEREWVIRADRLTHASFAAGGRHLVLLADDPAVSVWDVDTGAKVSALPAVGRGLGTVIAPPALGVDAPRYLAALAADARAVRFWDARTGAERPSFRLPAGEAVVSFVPSPDNETFAINARRSDTGGMVRYRGRVGDAAPGPPAPPDQGIFAYDPTGRWALTKSESHGDDVFGLLDVPAGRVVRLMRADGTPSYGSAVTPDGHWVAAYFQEGGVQVWDARNRVAGKASGVPVKPVRSVHLALGRITGVAFTAGDRLAVTSSGGRSVTVFDSPGGGYRDLVPPAYPAVRDAIGSPLPAVWFHPDGRRVFAAGAKGFDLWDEPTGRHLFADRADDSYVLGSVPDPAGGRFAVARGKWQNQGHTTCAVEVWDADPPRRLWSAGRAVGIRALGFGPGPGECVTADATGVVCVRDAATGAIRSEYRAAFAEGGRCTCVLTPDARELYWFLYGDQAGAVVVVTATADGRELRRFRVPEWTGLIDTVTYLDPGRLAVARLGDGVQVWDGVAGRWVGTLPGATHQRYPTWTAVGRRLLTAGGPELTFWNTQTWQKVFEVPGTLPFWPPRGLAVSPDGGRAAAVGAMGELRVWTLRGDPPAAP